MRNQKIIPVFCKRCGRPFRAVIHRRWISIQPLVEERYLQCDLCKEKYLIGIYDKKVKQMIKDKAPREEILQYQETLKRKYYPQE